MPLERSIGETNDKLHKCPGDGATCMRYQS